MGIKTADVVYMKFGSHLYGLNTPSSDTDYKGIYLPTLHELLLGNYPKTTKTSTGPEHEKNSADDTDTEVISLPRFVEMGMQGETFVLDMLHCNEPLFSSDIWESLVTHRTRFYSRKLKAFVGYVRRQASKYGIKGSRLSDIRQAINQLNRLTNVSNGSDYNLKFFWDHLYEGEFAQKIERISPSQTTPQKFYVVNGKMYQETSNAMWVSDQLLSMYTSYGHRAKLAEQNEGVDWKAISHALRAAYQARDIYKKGDFKYPLDETQYLLDVKQGKLDYKKNVGPELEAIVDIVEQLAAENIDLPTKVDQNFWEDWLLLVYQTKFGIENLFSLD